MPNDESIEKYATHGDLLSFVLKDAETRSKQIAVELRAAFKDFIVEKPTDWIVFEHVTAEELAKIFKQHPSVVKAVAAICNIAGRAIKQDLGFDIDTYNPKLTDERAALVAGYIKPFLPSSLAIPALEAIDDWFYKDKEIRAYKGRWEQHTIDALSARSGRAFKKRKFRVVDTDGQVQQFELDAASPPKGEPIDIGVDVKRIGHPRDIHKRSDEIVNKAEKFKKVYPNGRFGSVVYYPFEAEQANMVNRLRNDAIDAIVFAGESKESVEQAVLRLIQILGLDIADMTPPDSLFDELRDRRSE